ncbi:hypothetical protein [Brevundimonas sp.]|uniref:hypothetical protein n=1 Tax=Brevundimonas sp. TaxID=1871086 RepID=UPI00261587E0|nr:hypothetical protein [Brevundimonas sp.]
MGPFVLLWVAALALPQSAPEPEGLRIYSPAQFGVTAETPSRMPDSREEMNRGRNSAIGPSVQEQAADAVVRAGLVCAVAEAAVIGRTRDGGPLIEIDCVEGGGVIIADTDPLRVVDCLDLAPDTGQGGRRQRIVSACTLPGNAGLAGRGQSARN